MIRNLKVLIAAAMALAAFGALSATAHAAEEKFHCSVEPCTATLLPDETAGTTTAHHVFVVKGEESSGAEGSVSFTCNQLAGEATSATKTPTELTFTNLRYTNSAGVKKCKIGASEVVEVNFTSCDYNFKSLNGSTSTAQVHLLCSTAGDGIDINILKENIPHLCLKITPFTSTGLGYHDSAIGGAKKIATATANVAVPASVVMIEGASDPVCSVIPFKKIISATYTTGNTLVTAETDSPTPVMAEDWFE